MQRPIPPAAAVLGAWLLSAGCAGSGSVEVVTLRLSADEACYGIEIDVDERGLPAPDSGAPESCVAAPGLLALGCEAGTRIADDQYQLSVRGCFAPDGTDLFECTLPRPLAERFRDEAEVRCGCGCSGQCPSSFGASICDGNGENCEMGPHTLAAAAAPTKTAGARTGVQTDHGLPHATTVTSTTNHTYCDDDVDPGVASTGTDTIREIQFDLTFHAGDGCDFPYCGVDSPAIDGPDLQRHLSDHTLRVCLSSKAGFTSPADLLDCRAGTGGNDRFVIANVSALDERLRPITPPPVLVNDEND